MILALKCNYPQKLYPDPDMVKETRMLALEEFESIITTISQWGKNASVRGQINEKHKQ